MRVWLPPSHTGVRDSDSAEGGVSTRLRGSVRGLTPHQGATKATMVVLFSFMTDLKDFWSNILTTEVSLKRPAETREAKRERDNSGTIMSGEGREWRKERCVVDYKGVECREGILRGFRTVRIF